jgi:cystathionine beta-lyase/cystathionine gamma-synthase
VAGRTAELGALLADEVDGYVYGRYDNPTNTALHAVVAALHGAPAAWSLASGTAAIHAALDAVRGDGRILVTDRLYGGTWALLRRLEREHGWQVDHADLDAVDDHLTDAHTVVYAETIANPSTRVADLQGLGERCAARGIHLVVDNTFASPALCRPLEHGATVVVESATKFLAGHGDVVAGVVAGPQDVVHAVRHHTYELGTSLGPFEAWLVARGAQTLPLRYAASCRNAAVVAQRLAASGVAADVAHPSLPDHPDADRAAVLFDGDQRGAVLSFRLPDRPSAEAFSDACEVFLPATTLGGTHSLVLHPASTSHRQLDDAALAAAGITPGTVRLSLGIEDEADLLADVDRALAAAAAVSSVTS